MAGTLLSAKDMTANQTEALTLAGTGLAKYIKLLGDKISEKNKE